MSALSHVLRVATAAAAVLVAGCSIRQTGVNLVGDALVRGGGTFASDDDPELVAAAAPFSLKLMESLLAESPRHEGLLLAAASGFTQYAYAFVQTEAEAREDTDLAAARAGRARAKALYLRARGYGLRGLEVRHPGFGAALASDPQAALRRTTRADVPLLYWTAAAWGGAIALGKDDPALIGELPRVEALIDRARELDEAWGDGAIPALLMALAPARPGAADGGLAEARRHFDRAVEMSSGGLAAPFVAWAETFSVQRQDAAEFRRMLEQALAIDPGARPEWRLQNLVEQRRARRLLAREDELFLTP